MVNLTKSELRVFRLILKGFEGNKLCDELNLAKTTVENYRQSINRKLEKKTILGSILTAVSFGELYSNLERHRTKGILIKSNDFLSHHETFVLHEALKGKTNKQISVLSNRSVRTIEGHRLQINKKWRVKSKVDLVIKAIEKNYLRLENCLPKINLNNSKEIFNLISRDKSVNVIVIRYNIIFTTPSTIPLSLNEQQKSILSHRLSGYSNLEISEIFKWTKNRTSYHNLQLKCKLAYETYSEMVIKSIDYGLVVIDTDRECRVQSLTLKQIDIILKVGQLQKFNGRSQLIGYTLRDVQETINEISSLWRTKTIEGLLVSGLRRGDFEINQLRMIIQYDKTF